MIKKMTAVTAALLICAAVCSCGRVKEKPKQDIISSAEVIQLTRLGHELSDSVDDAKSRYDGGIYNITGYVSELADGHVTLSASAGVSTYSVSVQPSGDGLSSAREDHYITVAGTLHIGQNGECSMDPAYLVTDRYEISGTITKLYKGSVRYDSADYGIIKAEIGGEKQNVRINVSADTTKKYEVGSELSAAGSLIYDESGAELGALYTMQSPTFSD